MGEPAFISLGSNISPEKNLPAAIQAIKKLASPIDVSNIYRSPAVGPTVQAEFLNAGVRLVTEYEPIVLRNVLKSIEASLGRVRTEDKFAPRTIDLDLILLGNQIVEEGEFQLPDPDLLKQAHLAVPLAELDPNFRHPITKESLAIIAERLRPTSQLKLEEELSLAIRIRGDARD